MNKSLGTFFDSEVQRLIDSFAYCFRVKITVFSPDMEELIVGLQNPGAHFCDLIQTGLKIRYRCCRQDALMCESSKKHNRLMVYRCHAGLSEAVLPMHIEDHLVGYAMLGQFRMTSAPDAAIQLEWNKAGLCTEILQEAFESQPFFDQKSLNNMLDLFQMMISFVITRDYVRIRHNSVVESVLHWLDTHIDKPIDLNQVSKAIQKNPSTISHAFKKQLGLSFMQVAALKKISKFESIIAKNPATSIQEAAFAVGYSDPLYFSRLYKKIRLVPPSTYARSFKEAAIREEKLFIKQ